MVRGWLAVGIASAVLFGPYFCVWAQDSRILEERIKQWRVYDTVDPIFDTENTVAVLFDISSEKFYEDGKNKLYGNFLERLRRGVDMDVAIDIYRMENEALATNPETLKRLYFLCHEEKLSVAISWGSKLLIDPEKYDQEVIFRFDALEPQREVWNHSSIDDTAALVPNAMKFMLLTAMHKRLAARTDGSEGELTAIFNLEGVREVVPRVFETCSLPENILYEDVFGE